MADGKEPAPTGQATPKTGTGAPKKPKRVKWARELVRDRKKLLVSTAGVLGALVIVSVIALIATIGLSKDDDESLSECLSRLFGSKQICREDPPKFDLLRSTWNGRARSRGTVISYNCVEEKKILVATQVKCRGDGTWEEMFNNFEECGLDSEGRKLVDTGEVSGCVDEDPPAAGDYYRDWNGIAWTTGTVINYYCTKDMKVVVMIVECSADKEWVTKQNEPGKCNSTAVQGESEG